MPTVLMLLSKPFAGDPRVNRESNSLADAGYSVEVFAWNRDGVHQEALANDRIRVDLIGPPCPRRRFASFVFRLPRFWLACLRSSRKKDFSVVHSHDFDTLPIGFLVSRLRGKPLVYDAHESYADMIAKDAPSIIGRKIRFLERRLMKGASAIFVANENVSKLIGAENAVPLLNCPAESEIPIKCSEPQFAPRKTRSLAYFGSLEPGRFITESISVVSKLEDWDLVVGGDGTLADDVKMAAAASKNIEFLGHIPHEVVMEKSASCDALSVMLDPSNVNYRVSTPLRLFEAMSLGIPSIVTKGTYPAEIVQKEGCGFICDYDANAFSDLLVKLAKSPEEMRGKGLHGKQAFQREYKWEKQAERLLLAYSKLAGTGRGG